MKSFIAALRSLTLPFGATSGRRIVLDGINGLITIFDAGNNERIIIGESGDSIELITGTVGEATGGQLKAVGVNAGQPDAQAELEIISPSLAAPDNKVAAIILTSEADDGVEQPSIFMDAETVTFSPATVANGIFVELLGTLTASARLHVGGGTVFPSVDMFQGVIDIDTGGDIQIGDESIGRGLSLTPAWRFEKTTDTVLSATAGTYTTIISTGNIALKTGRLYRVMAKPGAYLISSGSGFAAGDTWRWRVHRSVAGGAFSTARIGKAMRSNVAIASVIGLADSWTYFALAADANVDFRMEAAKTTGAGTVNSTVSVDAGEGYSEISVEDVGAFTAATALH